MFLSYSKRIVFFIAFTIAIKTSLAQSSATVTASASIVILDEASVSEKLNFENNITIANQNITNAVSMKRTNEYKMIASYSISNYAYAVTIPGEQVILTKANGNESFSAQLTIQYPCNEQSDLCSPVIIMGAIFNISGDLQPGNYISATPCNITINYN